MDFVLYSSDNLTLTGSGSLTVTAKYNDGIVCKDTLKIISGSYTVKSADDGIIGKDCIIIAGGTFNINAAGKNDVESFFDIGSSSNNNILTISGGIVKVDASGDGLDANGSIYITGCEVFVNGPENDGNGALDYNNTFEISGGILVCVGSSGMAQSPSSSSEQSFVATNNVSGSSGSVITVKDSSGNEIYSYTASKKFASVVFSSSKIKSGESYTVSVDGSNDVTVTAGTELGGFGGFVGNGGFGVGPRGDFNGDPPDNNFGRNGTPPDNNFGGSGIPPDFPNKRNDATVK